MPRAPAISDLEQLKDRPIVAALLAWKPDAVQSAKFDRNELSIYVARELVRDACNGWLGDRPALGFGDKQIQRAVKRLGSL